MNASLVEHGSATPGCRTPRYADHSEGEHDWRTRYGSGSGPAVVNLLLDRPLDGALMLLPDSTLGLSFPAIRIASSPRV